MNINITSQKFNSEKGTILLIVLIFVMAITIIVLVSHIRSITEIGYLDNEFSKLRAYLSCFSGTQFTFNRILTSTKNRIEFLDIFQRRYSPRLMLDGSDILLSVFDMVNEKYHHIIPEPIAEQITEQHLKIHLQDSAGLINFFRIQKDLLMHFFENNKISNDQAQIIVDSVMDWMDTDAFARQSGAEKDFYLNNNYIIPPNRLIYSPEELLLVRGINREIFQKIGNLIDVTIQNRGLNPNTAPPEIFRLLFGIHDDQVGNIIRIRNGQEFGNLKMLTQRSNYNFSRYPNTFQFFTSDTVYVTISALMSDNREFFFRIKLYLARRSKSEGADSFKGGLRSLNNNVSSRMILSEILYIDNWSEGTKQIQ